MIAIHLVPLIRSIVGSTSKIKAGWMDWYIMVVGLSNEEALCSKYRTMKR